MRFHVLPPLDDPGATFRGTRAYVASAGRSQLAHEDDLHGLALAGWHIVGPRGASHERPANPEQGALFVDNEAGALLTFDRGVWRDVLLGAPVPAGSRRARLDCGPVAEPAHAA